MQRPRHMQRPGGSDWVYGSKVNMAHVQPWAATVAQVRDAILAGRVGGPDYSQQFDLDPQAAVFAPSQREVDRVSDMCARAIMAGRMIDFGYWTNEAIMFGGERGGDLWNANAVGMPFSEPWILYHIWEGGTGIELVNPVEDAEQGPGFEAGELQPIIFGDDGSKVLVIHDRGTFFQNRENQKGKYKAFVLPAQLRWIRDPELRARANGGPQGTPGGAAGGNIGDPVMLALLMLNTRGIERTTIKAPDKLQKARAKSRKLPIPDYDQVNSRAYITAVSQRKSGPRGEDRGGTHRSPIAHLRLGHPRTYATGRSIFIKDTLVNVPEEQRAQFKSQRTHYDASRMDRP